MSILNKLTIKHLLMNKKRTIVTIIGIILSTALMVGMGLLLSTFREAMIDEMVNSKGDYNLRINKIDNNNISILNNNLDIDKYIYRSYLGYSYIENDSKNYYKIYGINENYMKHLKLIEGRMPENGNEIIIPSYLTTLYDGELKIGDTIRLDVGDRYYEEYKIYDYGTTYDEEYIKVNYKKDYTIVGIIERDYYEDHEIGCFVYTIGDSNEKEVFITFKKVNKTFELSKSLITSLNIGYGSNEYYDRVSYNDSLLSLYGTSKYSNMISSLSGMLAIMLGLVSVACIIVIYNSFAISVMERKKQFGLMSSIGATKSQIRHTVMFEALIVSVIGIPLGILASYIGIGIVVSIMDKLLKNIFVLNFKLTTYPLFIIIPIIFMLITIFISAIIPAKKASKISPIEAIRMNDDIKIKGNKVKSPKIISKIFGVTGDIAYKNMKRNKKKYRITIISLFISIVLFISSSGYMRYIVEGSVKYANVPQLDIVLSYGNNASKEIVNSIIKHKDIQEYTNFMEIPFYTNSDLSRLYSSKYLSYLQDRGINNLDGLKIVIFDNDSYDNYLSKIGKREKLPILYNGFSSMVYTSGSRKNYNLNRYNNNIININICDRNNDDEDVYCLSNIDKYYITNENFIGVEIISGSIDPVIIISEDMVSTLGIDNIFERYNYTAYIKATNYKDIDELVDKYDNEGKLNNIYYTNIHEEMKELYNFIFVIKLLIYGFIALVTLIGVTSVFNTISTSITLRRKEFAVLRSIGLTPKEFNKMIRFESLFFGIKSLIYALPVSFGIIYLMHLSMKNMVMFDSMLIPWNNIIIAIFAVFIIILLTMSYSTRKIKKDNILDAIREENI